MAKKKLQVSKVLLKAVSLSFLSLLVVAVVCFVTMAMTPHSVYNKILQWELMNKLNPDIYYTAYYRRLSLIANMEDWMLVTPLAYSIGGLVFGMIVSSKRDQWYTLRTGATTSLFFTAAILTMCYFSNTLLTVQAQQEGTDLRMNPFTMSEVYMGLIQAVYWIAVFMIGTFVGCKLNFAKRSAVLPLRTSTPVA